MTEEEKPTSEEEKLNADDCIGYVITEEVIYDEYNKFRISAKPIYEHDYIDLEINESGDMPKVIGVLPKK
ncbi:MAG: hypothetical protein KAW45_02870 [Thermoplasmatales archaeon]|nr:hypothetical protein [Thermoplasmatales archaeon]